MGKLAVYKYLAMMFLVIQIIITVFTIVALYGGDVTPIGNTARAMLVYALPLLIIANILMCFYWLIRRRWLMLIIPVVTIACCIPYIGTLVQIRSIDKHVEANAGLKIATYNVAWMYVVCKSTPTSAVTKRTQTVIRNISPIWLWEETIWSSTAAIPSRKARLSCLTIPTTVPCGQILT